MTTLILLLSATVPAADPAKTHLDLNPNYRILLERGVRVGDGPAVKLPPPTLADGADDAARKAAYATFVDDSRNPLDSLMNPAVTAPFEIHIRDAEGADPARPMKAVDMWFFAHGKFEQVVAEAFRKTLLRLSQGSYKHTDVTEADLAKRKIVLEPMPGVLENYYVRRTMTLFDKVEVHETNHVVMSRTADSLLIATRLDPRFIGDAEFPCQWKPVTVEEDGSLKAGEAKPYEGVGYYMKATRIPGDTEMVLFEMHFVCHEPQGWFDGANLLQPKLPLLLRTEVRRIRKDLAAASR